MAKVTRYKCENCGRVNTHINSYDDHYCYDCIDIETGKLKPEFVKSESDEKLGEPVK